MGDLLGNSLSPQWMQSSSALFEMGKAIGVQFDDEKYEIFQRWCQYVDWIFPFEGICIVCDRPSTVRWDSEGRIHADGNPAVRFDDGFEVWARHGVRLVRGMVFA
jgi:hypothetical protein